MTHGIAFNFGYSQQDSMMLPTQNEIYQWNITLEARIVQRNAAIMIHQLETHSLVKKRLRNLHNRISHNKIVVVH